MCRYSWFSALRNRTVRNNGCHQSVSQYHFHSVTKGTLIVVFGREQKKERKKTHHFVIEAYITLASLFTYLLERNFASFAME